MNENLFPTTKPGARDRRNGKEIRKFIKEDNKPARSFEPRFEKCLRPLKPIIPLSERPPPFASANPRVGRVGSSEWNVLWTAFNETHFNGPLPASWIPHNTNGDVHHVRLYKILFAYQRNKAISELNALAGEKRWTTPKGGWEYSSRYVPIGIGSIVNAFKNLRTNGVNEYGYKVGQAAKNDPFFSKANVKMLRIKASYPLEVPELEVFRPAKPSAVSGRIVSSSTVHERGLSLVSSGVAAGATLDISLDLHGGGRVGNDVRKRNHREQETQRHRRIGNSHKSRGEHVPRVGLCRQFEKFGTCNRENCKFQHVVKDLGDVIDDLSSVGDQSSAAESKATSIHDSDFAMSERKRAWQRREDTLFVECWHPLMIRVLGVFELQRRVTDFYACATCCVAPVFSWQHRVLAEIHEDLKTRKEFNRWKGWENGAKPRSNLFLRLSLGRDGLALRPLPMTIGDHNDFVVCPRRSSNVEGSWRACRAAIPRFPVVALAHVKACEKNLYAASVGIDPTCPYLEVGCIDVRLRTGYRHVALHVENRTLVGEVQRKMGVKKHSNGWFHDWFFNTVAVDTAPIIASNYVDRDTFGWHGVNGYNGQRKALVYLGLYDKLRAEFFSQKKFDDHLTSKMLYEARLYFGDLLPHAEDVVIRHTIEAVHTDLSANRLATATELNAAPGGVQVV